MDAQELAEELVRSASTDPEVQEWSAADPPENGGPDEWTPRAEAAHAMVENSLGEQVPVLGPHVVVWTSVTLDAPEKFPGAVAQVLPNGTLLVTRRGSQVPIKGYANGTWSTFEHVGEEYHERPLRYQQLEDGKIVPRVDPPMTDRERTKEYTLGVVYGGGHPVLSDTGAEDTQTIERVADETAGGGVAGPKARGSRAGAVDAGRTLRPGTADPDPDEPTPGWWRTLGRALRGEPSDL